MFLVFVKLCTYFDFSVGLLLLYINVLSVDMVANSKPHHDWLTSF